MRKILGLILMIGLAGPAWAQFTVNQHDGTTDYTSRGFTGSNDGWAFNRFAHDKQGGGIGVSGIVGWNCIMQDQNAQSLENFQFAIFDQLTTFNGSPIPPGSVGSVPDVTQVVAQTSVFASPGGPASPRAWGWTMTLTTPIPSGTYLTDLFTGTFLEANQSWTADGASSHISIVGQGGSQEYPCIYPPGSNSEAECLGEYGVVLWPNGVIGSMTQQAPTYPGSARFWINRLRYEHGTRAGADDPGGAWPTGTPIKPNLGWAGSYPDLMNWSATATPRLDEVVWEGRHTTMNGATVTGQILLATSLARNGILGAPLPLPGVGLLELDPLDPLFTVTSAAGWPGLATPAPTSSQLYVPVPGLQAFAPVIITPLHTSNVNLYCQELRIDLGGPSLSLGSLDSHSFRDGT